MPPAPVNRNLRRRLMPGLLALAAGPALDLLLRPLRRRPRAEAHLDVFASYMVGDLFMALPALKRLAAARPIRVISRPDCAGIVRSEGLEPLPFENAFFTRRGPLGFLRTLRAAWRLRRMLEGTVLDLDADPRSAFWLRVAGAPRVVSYQRSFGVLFDEVFTLPQGAIHQSDRDMAVVEGFLRGFPSFVGSRVSGVGSSLANSGKPFQSGSDPTPDAPSPDTRLPTPDGEVGPEGKPWLLSVWTRKAAKNWPLARWEEFLDRLRAEGVPFAILDAPDGDAGFRAFRDRWRDRAEFVRGDLEEIAGRVRGAAGVVATDNFLGHMAGYYGKPVLWINIASPAAQVRPRGPHTWAVEAERPGEGAALTGETVWRAFGGLRAAVAAAV